MHYNLCIQSWHILIRPSEDFFEFLQQSYKLIFHVFGKVYPNLDGFFFLPLSTMFITSVSSILGSNFSLFLFRASRMSRGKFGPLPFLPRHDPTLLSHSHHPHPRFGKETVYPLGKNFFVLFLGKQTREMNRKYK